MRNKNRSMNASLFFGLLFVIIGVVWILNEFDIIHISLYLIFESIGRMWPLILIALGICLIFRNRIVTLIVSLLYIVIIILGAYSLAGTIYFPFINNHTNHHYTTENIQYRHIEKVDNITSSELNLTLGIAENVTVKPTDTDYLLDLQANFVPTVDVENSSNKQIVDLNTKNITIENLVLSLNKNNVWDLSITSGTSELYLDLEDLNVASVNIESGVSDVDGIFSSLSQKTIVTVSSGASDIEFKIPQNSACQVISSSAATSIEVDGTQLSGIGEKTYESGNIDTAEIIFYFNVSSGASDIKIEYY